MADSSVSVPVIAPSGNRDTGIGHVCERLDDGTITGFEDGAWSVWGEYRSLDKQEVLRRGFYRGCEDAPDKEVELLGIAFRDEGYRTCSPAPGGYIK